MLNQTLSTFWGICKYFIDALILFCLEVVELFPQETYILVKTLRLIQSLAYAKLKNLPSLVAL